MRGIYPKNSIFRSLIDNTNIFGIGKTFTGMRSFSGLHEAEYVAAEFLNGKKVSLGDIFHDGKVIAIKETDDKEDIRIVINPIIYDEKSKKSIESNDPVSFKYNRRLFSELKIKRN